MRILERQTLPGITAEGMVEHVEIARAQVQGPASRIEQLNKHFQTTLLMSKETHDRVQGAVRARRLDPVAVKGKSAPITVYEVLELLE